MHLIIAGEAMQSSLFRKYVLEGSSSKIWT
jgi:hypothetical protein